MSQPATVPAVPAVPAPAAPEDRGPRLPEVGDIIHVGHADPQSARDDEFLCIPGLVYKVHEPGNPQTPLDIYAFRRRGINGLVGHVRFSAGPAAERWFWPALRRDGRTR
jgi:hypothetical protein